jgi:hypothetical protein
LTSIQQTPARMIGKPGTGRQLSRKNALALGNEMAIAGRAVDTIAARGEPV